MKNLKSKLLSLVLSVAVSISALTVISVPAFAKGKQNNFNKKIVQAIKKVQKSKKEDKKKGDTVNSNVYQSQSIQSSTVDLVKLQQTLTSLDQSISGTVTLATYSGSNYGEVIKQLRTFEKNINKVKQSVTKVKGLEKQITKEINKLNKNSTQLSDNDKAVLTSLQSASDLLKLYDTKFAGYLSNLTTQYKNYLTQVNSTIKTNKKNDKNDKKTKQDLNSINNTINSLNKLIK
jgi:DNA repair exonuclease SbcCD ATPase subunit